MLDRLTGIAGSADSRPGIKSTDKAFSRAMTRQRPIHRSPGGAGHHGLLGPDAGQHRRGVRRYRNLATLRISRSGPGGGAWQAVNARHRARRAQLILWALFIVVTAKYVLLLLRADNNGEGGTLSLMALGQRALGRRSWPLLALGVLGASMFIGNSMITPAISVLSAVEGLKLVTPALDHYVVPLTVFILVGLFSVQSSGTARVASAFGPVMVVWFAIARGDGAHAHQRRSLGAGGDQSLVRASNSCCRTAPSGW